MTIRSFLSTLALGLAVLTPFAANAQTVYYGNGPMWMYQGHRGFNHHGVIASVTPSNFQFRDGQTVFLKQGTVINPTGTKLAPGMRVWVHGSRAGNGNINAIVVNLHSW